jgi:hypothetical protein
MFKAYKIWGLHPLDPDKGFALTQWGLRAAPRPPLTSIPGSAPDCRGEKKFNFKTPFRNESGGDGWSNTDKNSPRIKKKP